jgi:hypothetical protein
MGKTHRNVRNHASERRLRYAEGGDMRQENMEMVGWIT